MGHLPKTKLAYFSICKFADAIITQPFTFLDLTCFKVSIIFPFQVNRHLWESFCHSKFQFQNLKWIKKEKWKWHTVELTPFAKFVSKNRSQHFYFKRTKIFHSRIDSDCLVWPGFHMPCRITCTSENDKSSTHVLIDRVEIDFVFSLQMINAILLVGKLSSALCALKRVLLSALVLQVTVQVVVPVVRTLTMWTRVNAFWFSVGCIFRLLLFANFVLRFLLSSLFFNICGIVGSFSAGPFSLRSERRWLEGHVWMQRRVVRWGSG